MARFPTARMEDFFARVLEWRSARKSMRQAIDTDQEAAAKVAFRSSQNAMRRSVAFWLVNTVARGSTSNSAFRERLVLFWADHFTAAGKRSEMLGLGPIYVDSAIRPKLTGKFEDLLIAVVTNPAMLHYLDQHLSVGPASQTGRRSNGNRGLNENLAREVLELHTLGVGGPYTQTDVRELAELFTGLHFSLRNGFAFRAAMAEPGSETVLGKVYRAASKSTMAPIEEVLRDLARHPVTARHIATKLAVHFVSDDPEPALIGHVTARYIETDGDLMATYSALLEHPAAWQKTTKNAKLPLEFVISACRALDVSSQIFEDLKYNQVRSLFALPLRTMGFDWQRPKGPDGLPEHDDAWITPQSLSERINWAMQVPQKLKSDLPDPRLFVQDALGSFASSKVTFAAGAAESKSEGIGLVLASPAFQYR